MQETGERHSRGRAARTLVSGFALVAVLAGNGSAQEPRAPSRPPVGATADNAPVSPVAISGWRYQKRVLEGAALHQFSCEKPSCGPHSVVSYRIYPPSQPMSLEKFQQNEETVLTALRQRAAPGTKISLLDIKSSGSGGVPAWFQAQRLTQFPNGTKEYRFGGTMLGKKYSATLISTSQDENSARNNLGAFFVPLFLFINGATIAQ